MKIKLRNVMLLMLLITVFVPIVIVSNILGVYFPSSSARNELVEEASTFTFAGETSPLKVLHHELSTKSKDSRDGFFSTDAANASSGNGNTRQLGEGLFLLTDDRSRNSTVVTRKSTDHGGARQNDDRFNPPVLNGTSEISMAKNDSIRKRKESPDFCIRQFKDRISEGRFYLSLSSTQNDPRLMQALRARLNESTEALGNAANDSELRRDVYEKMKALERSVFKAKQMQEECCNTKKLHALIVSTESQLRSTRKQASYLTQLAAKTIPRGLHCLALRLSTDYFSLNSSQRHFRRKPKVDDRMLFHYALFSDNVLAAGVVVNSTVSHAKDPSKHVFHVVTDGLNYASMKMWFLSNPPGAATIDVAKVEDFTWLNASYSPVLKQLTSRKTIDYYYYGTHDRWARADPNAKYRNPKYLSIMNHLRFYLPEIFPKLDKILFLDDDVVVQKDLTPLWAIGRNGKVAGVVETCGEKFHRFDHYLNFSNPLIAKLFDPRACGWAFGMNIFDLREWRRQNITQIYHKWQELNGERLLWKLGTLPPGLLTFWNRSFVLEKSWHVLGLGYDAKTSTRDIERAAVIHYNGNAKPWLEIGIAKFRSYWTKYVDYDQKYLRNCNVTP